jgi:HTH-type transcriptional repressor of NAD biosynthesis genes
VYNTGVYFGKLLPPHRGHLAAIINASTQCEKLYVIVSDNKDMTERICAENSIPVMDARTRVQWMCQELQDINHIEVLFLDETNIPEPPNGWKEWCEILR